VNYGKVVAVIDFGSMGVGDPACDFVIAWNYFSARSRSAFKESLEFDSNTWARARGWALWKYLIMLVELQDIKSSTVHTKLNEIDDIMREHQQIYRYP
jgi:aminoglycoside phosphotransferase (APT) family kinase protein